MDNIVSNVCFRWFQHEDALKAAETSLTTITSTCDDEITDISALLQDQVDLESAFKMSTGPPHRPCEKQELVVSSRNKEMRKIKQRPELG